MAVTTVTRRSSDSSNAASAPMESAWDADDADVDAEDEDTAAAAAKEEEEEHEATEREK